MRALVIAILVAAATTNAAAEPIPNKAKVLAEQGRKAHAAGDFRLAIDSFEQAYVLAPSSNLLFNLAQAYRLAGDCENALIMYHRFLESGPTVEAATVAGVHMRAMERCVHPEPLGPTVMSATMHLQLPASTKVAVAKRPATTTTHVSHLHTRIGTALAIAGVAALGVSLVYAIDARSASNDVSAMYARGAKWKDVQATDERGHHDNAMALGFGIGGALALGGATSLYIHDRVVGVSWSF